MEPGSVHVTMVKKRLASGEACRKCIQAEELLRARGAWERIDQVVWAIENDPESEGMRLARHHRMDGAPFFVVDEGNGAQVAYPSVLKLLKERFDGHAQPPAPSTPAPSDLDSFRLEQELSKRTPQEIVRYALMHFGRDCAIAFSGAEDVVLVDMAVKSGCEFTLFSLDTGRLHPETYRFIDRVRSHYGVEIELLAPDAPKLQAFVRTKGLFSFYEDGHQECCGVRKVEPLRRMLAKHRAWMTGQRRDQSPTRAHVPAVQPDNVFAGKQDGALLKFNPLAGWSSAATWTYVRDHQLPYNALHERGFVSIGCEPCTRPTLPGQHEREGRWWWEESTKKECGLHSLPPPPPVAPS